MSNDLVQMRGLVRAESMVGAIKPGRIFWCTQAQALHFIEHRIAILAGAVEAKPQETKPAEPSVLKTEEPEPKKSSVEEPAGPSTASVELSASGQNEQPSASLPDTASTLHLPKKPSPFSGLIRNKRK